MIAAIEFILSYFFYRDNMNSFSYLINSYDLLKDITYTKYIITEIILCNSMPNYLFSKVYEKELYIFYFKEELSKYSEEISNIVNGFGSANIDFPKEYKNYISNTNITIKTLSNGIEKEEEQSFFSAINKLTTSLFYISTINNNSLINMNNTYSYELMVNLLDGYYIAFEKIIIILVNDFKDKAKESRIKNIIIFFICLFFSCFYLIIFWKIMKDLNNDREKPINLFLTIKKKIFEDLKYSAENFSNKLLNKFFGVDENEEESQHNYRANVTQNDINIAKFKTLNEFKSLNNKKNSFTFYFLQLIIFYFFYLIFFFIKYINRRFYYSNIEKFTIVYNSTQFSQIYLLTRIVIVKQYFYNSSILNYNMNNDNMIYNFLQCFTSITDQFKVAIKQNSKSNSFLSDEYTQLFLKDMYHNYSEILTQDENNIENLKQTIKKGEIGFKASKFEIFEKIRFLITKYLIDEERNKTNNNISELVNDKLWIDIGNIIFYLIRTCYQNLNPKMNSSFFSVVGDKIIQSIIILFIVIVLVSIYYWIIWKRYEIEFIRSIKKSFELINLIPEEIKNIIISKLNE